MRARILFSMALLGAASSAKAGTFYLEPGESAEAYLAEAPTDITFLYSVYTSHAWTATTAVLDVSYSYIFLTNGCAPGDSDPDCDDYHEVYANAWDRVTAGSMIKFGYLGAPTYSSGYDGDIYFYNNGPGLVRITMDAFPDHALRLPEPSAWALMLSGFGIIGSAMRYRRRPAVSFA